MPGHRLRFPLPSLVDLLALVRKSFQVQWPDLLSQLLSFDNWLPTGWQWLTWGGAWGVTCAHSRPHNQVLDQNANILRCNIWTAFWWSSLCKGCSLRLVVTVGGVHCRAIPPQVMPLSHNRGGLASRLLGRRPCAARQLLAGMKLR